MVQPAELIVIGYWAGPEAPGDWPDVRDFVDTNWDPEERDFVAYYLSMGVVARTYMGFSACRICGEDNGDMELTDGTFVWPDGLRHYVDAHRVRMPDSFVRHAAKNLEDLENANRDVSWWQTSRPGWNSDKDPEVEPQPSVAARIIIRPIE